MCIFLDAKSVVYQSQHHHSHSHLPVARVLEELLIMERRVVGSYENKHLVLCFCAVFRLLSLRGDLERWALLVWIMGFAFLAGCNGVSCLFVCTRDIEAGEAG